MSRRSEDTPENRAEREKVYRALQDFVAALGFQANVVTDVIIKGSHEVTLVVLQQDENGLPLRDGRNLVLRAITVGSSELFDGAAENEAVAKALKEWEANRV